MIEVKDFGELNGKKVDLYKASNKKGNYIEIISYGCRIKSINIMDKNGKMRNVCLGHDTLEEYEKDIFFLGAFVGRYANRISGASCEIDGVKYYFDKNEGNNHIHGGFKNFSNCVWDSKIEDDCIIFSKKIVDMEGGYPGNLEVDIKYKWTEDDELSIEYYAKTDKDTLVNFTNHSYFNLSGSYNNVFNHELKLYADSYTPTDEEWIPTGEIVSVAGTPFDFEEFHKIGDRINDDNEQLKIGKGYDHNYATGDFDYKIMAEVYCEETGITMKCYSDQPGIQFYSGNNLFTDERIQTKFEKNSGFCLETQNYPDAINIDDFPSAVLKAGDVYYTKTSYIFE